MEQFFFGALVGGIVAACITGPAVLYLTLKPVDKDVITAGIKYEVHGGKHWFSFADLYCGLERSPMDMPVLRQVIEELVKEGYLEEDGPSNKRMYRHKQKQPVHSPKAG